MGTEIETGGCGALSVRVGDDGLTRAQVEIVRELTADVERLTRERAEAAAEIERLTAQLPDGMQHCTIKFIECEKGHGRLTATNWIDHGCSQCKIERLTAALEPFAKAAKSFGPYSEDMEHFMVEVVVTLEQLRAAERACEQPASAGHEQNVTPKTEDQNAL